MKVLKDLNWNRVYCFYEVARKSSMKEAAKILGVSVPTISDHIRKLEKDINITLFHRSPRKLTLTKEGSALYNYAKNIFASGKKFLDAVSPDTIGGYAVTVGIQENISSLVSLEFLSHYWDLYANFGTVNTKKIISLEYLGSQLLQGELDWGMTFSEPMDTKLSYKKIGNSDIVFCCSKLIFKRFKDKHDIIRNIPFAKNHWAEDLNRIIEDRFIQTDAFPEEYIETDHSEFLHDLVQRGRCVTTLSQRTVNTASWAIPLATFSIGDPIRLPIYAVWAKGNENMIAIKKLCDLIDKRQFSTQFEDPYLQISVSGIASEKLTDDYYMQQAAYNRIEPEKQSPVIPEV